MGVQLIRKVRDRQPDRFVKSFSLPFSCGFYGSNLTRIGVHPAIKTAAAAAYGRTTTGKYGCAFASDSTTYTASALALKNYAHSGNFSVVAAIKINAVTGAGVCIRDRGYNILLRSNAGNFSVRINNIDYNGSAFITGQWLLYVLSSSPSGVFLIVNGNSVISGAAVSGATMGTTLDFFADSVGGGYANMEIAMFSLIRRGLSIAEMRSISANLWKILEPETIPLFYSTVTAQFARPTADSSTGTWTASTGSDLFAMLDETTADDGDYIITSGASTCEVALTSLSDPASSAGHVVRYRISATSGGITVRLRQGTTTIATWTHATAPTSLTTYTQTLTGGEADSITDYSALRLQFEAT